MNFIQSIIIITGLVMFLNEMFVKFNVYGFMEKMAADAKTKFMNELLQCRFCIRFHLTWITTIAYGGFCGFFWLLVVVPFVVSGITQNTIKNGL